MPTLHNRVVKIKDNFCVLNIFNSFQNCHMFVLFSSLKCKFRKIQEVSAFDLDSKWVYKGDKDAPPPTGLVDSFQSCHVFSTLIAI